MIQDAIKKCQPGELIFIDDLYLVDSNVGRVRMQLKRLADSGKLNRFGRGVYYKPHEDGADFDIKTAISSLIEKRFLKDGEDICGYIIDTDKRDELSDKPNNPNIIELASNKATIDYKEFKIGDATVIVRRPRIPVNRENCKVLATLDLIKDIQVIPNRDSRFATLRDFYGKRLLNYLKKIQVDVDMFLDYIEMYPDKTIRNLWLLQVSREDIRKLYEKNNDVIE